DNRCDAQLAEILVNRSRSTLLWMRNHGIRFVPQYASQSVRENGRIRFFGGATLEVWGGGSGLMDGWRCAGERDGVHILYDAQADSLLHGDGGVRGVRAMVG